MKKLLLLFSLIAAAINAQSGITFFPSDLNIQPFTANTLEPKLGTNFQISKNELRLDIGNSIDVLHYKLNEDTYLSFGADFFTYTLLRGEKNFHFPVDAVDYLFGINAGFKKFSCCYEYGFRLRLSHISAHFVDGHFDGPNQQWRNQLNPRVYSREFLEFFPYIKFNNLRLYAGLTYIFHVDPRDLGKDSYQLGFDYFAVKLLGEHLTPFIAYDIKLVNLYEYSANNSFMIGIKFGRPFANGISLYYQYYSGKSVHGEYFDFNKKFSAVGFNLDL